MSRLLVSGSRSAMPNNPPTPGMAPTSNPISTPAISMPMVTGVLMSVRNALKTSKRRYCTISRAFSMAAGSAFSAVPTMASSCVPVVGENSRNCFRMSAASAGSAIALSNAAR